LGESGKRRDAGFSAYLYALLTARSQAFMEAWDMKKQKVTFEQLMMKVLTESGQLEKLHQEGIVQGVHQTARNLRNMGCDNEFIVTATGLAPADIAAL
jgi:hypothetical protein